MMMPATVTATTTMTAAPPATAVAMPTSVALLRAPRLAPNAAARARRSRLRCRGAATTTTTAPASAGAATTRTAATATTTATSAASAALPSPASLPPAAAALGRRGLADAVPTYDPVAAEQLLAARPLDVARRFVEVTLTMGAFGVALGWDFQRQRVETNIKARAAMFRECLTALGPAFVKVGQALSTRPDLLPGEYLEELSQLQDDLPTFPDQEAFRCIEAQLGAPLERLYAKISPRPIAAASLGQVYKAVLPTGEEVAVKVQRPDVAKGIEIDFYIVRVMAGLVDKYVSLLNTSLVAFVDEFACRVYEELDYTKEGENAVKFKELYGDRPEVVVPDIYWDRTNTRVLTMQWIDGVKLSAQDEIKAQGLDVLNLVDIGIQCSLRQLLEYGFFHADPHPGNLLATPSGKLAFLDFGMMSETPSDIRFAIINHVVHLVNRDYEAMALDYYQLEFLDEGVDVSGLVPDLENFFDDVLEASVSELNFKTITDGLGAVLFQYPFNVPAYYALILRSLTVLEGLALYTDPNFKVLAKAYPYMARRLLTDPAPQLRTALIELLFKDGVFRWNRLENLLREGRQNDDFAAGAAIQPLLELLLSDKYLQDEDGRRLRKLIESEAVRVTEALVLGGVMDVATDERIPKGLLPPQLQRPLIVNEEDMRRTMALREQVMRVWALLSTSRGFNPQSLQPLLQVLQTPEYTSNLQVSGVRVVNSLGQRIAARALQTLLRETPSQPALEGGRTQRL